MNNPYVPNSKANIAIISRDTPIEIAKNLEKKIKNIIYTEPLMGLPVGLRFHPDLALCPVDRNTVVSAPSVYDYYKGILEPLGVNVIEGGIEPQEKYPLDVPYNVAILNNYAIFLERGIDIVLHDEIQKRGYKSINIKQGYSKCSVAITGHTSAITSDRLLYDKLVRKGFKVLYIEPGNIVLPGYNYGFIGGATGLLSDNELLVAGSLQKHPSKDIIYDFLKSENIDIIELSDGNIVDIGSILTFSVFN